MNHTYSALIGKNIIHYLYVFLILTIKISLIKKNNYESYQQHHHKYVPHVQIGSVKSKIQDSKSTGQITFIEPEIRWLCRGLKELAELSLEDTENSLDDTTEEGTWALDYAKVQLNILTAFRNAMDESEPESLWNLYDDLNESEY